MPTLFFKASWEDVKAYFRKEVTMIAKKMIGVKLIIPKDVVVALSSKSHKGQNKVLEKVAKNDMILDAGKATIADWQKISQVIQARSHGYRPTD